MEDQPEQLEDDLERSAPASAEQGGAAGEPPPRPTEPPEPDEDGNYDSPALRALRRVWEDFVDEKAEEAHVMGVVAELDRFANAQLAQLNRQIEEGTAKTEEESFKLIYEAFEILLDATDMMAFEFVEPEEEMEEPEEGFFLTGLELVQEATNQMMEGHNLALEHIQATSEICCMFCNHKNPRGIERCQKCGRALPKMPGQPVQSSFTAVQEEGLDRKSGPRGANVTENYVILAQGVGLWRENQIDAERLFEGIEEIEQRLIDHQNDLPDQRFMVEDQAPEHQREALLEAIDLTQEGLERSLAALDRMKLAFEKEDDTYLELGLSEFEEASKLLVQAFHANQKAARLGGP